MIQPYHLACVLLQKIFNAIADAVKCVLKQCSIDGIIHYLDDFLLIGQQSSGECAAALSTLLQVFDRLELPVAIEKLEGPTSRLTFLGIQLNSVGMEVCLPPSKLSELMELLQSWLGKRRCRRSELESLVGKLAHASTVVKPGKMFMRRMFELLAGTKRAFYHIHLGRSFQSDLQWWLTFLEAWNGVTILRTHQAELPSFHIWSDASGCVGCGAVEPASHRWFQFKWPQQDREELRPGR